MTPHAGYLLASPQAWQLCEDSTAWSPKCVQHLRPSAPGQTGEDWGGVWPGRVDFGLPHKQAAVCGQGMDIEWVDSYLNNKLDWTQNTDRLQEGPEQAPALFKHRSPGERGPLVMTCHGICHFVRCGLLGQQHHRKWKADIGQDYKKVQLSPAQPITLQAHFFTVTLFYSVTFVLLTFFVLLFFKL